MPSPLTHKNLNFGYHFQIKNSTPCRNRRRFLKIDLLEMIPGVKIQHIQADCCGIAGTYGYKKEKYQISQDVGRPLFDQVKASGSSIVLCDSETCRWQIAHATGAQLIHPIELLAQAYGLDY